jgi:hypothetical protein
MDNLESEEIQDKYKTFFLPIIKDNYYTSSVFPSADKEINIIRKRDLAEIGVIHPFYFRRTFSTTRKNLFQDSFIELNNLCNIFIGQDLEGDTPYQDEYMIDKENYIAVLSNLCIRAGDFIDISKIKFFDKHKIKDDNFTYLKTNDVVLSFNINRNDKLTASSSIIPTVLEGAILGKNILLLRAISERILPLQIGLYLNILIESGLLRQFLYFLELKEEFI